MSRALLPVLVGLLMFGCASFTPASRKWPTQDPYVRIERWQLAGGVGYACVVTHQTVSIRTLNDFSKPSRVLFHRRLSSDEFHAVLDAVEESRLLEALGEYRTASPRDDVIVLSDGRLDRFSFREPNPTPIKEASIEYQNYSDDAARLVFASVDELLPQQYRFGKRK